MNILNVKLWGERLPPGAFYIGRAIPKHRAPSRLANRYSAKKGQHVVHVPSGDVGAVLERYRRHLTGQLVAGGPELDAMRLLEPTTKLACWCTQREAVLVGHGRPRPPEPCHGDVIYTVWATLERLAWMLVVTDRRGRRIEWDPRSDKLLDRSQDLDAHDAVWSGLYAEAFGEPMRWGTRGDLVECPEAQMDFESMDDPTRWGAREGEEA